SRRFTMAKTFEKLSRAAIRKLPKGQRITEHGITFERLANGDGLYTVNIMVDRQRIHRTIGRESEGVTRTTAEDFISKARHDAREGRLNLPKRRKVALTFAAAAPLYIERLRQEGGKNIDRKQAQLDQSLVPYLGNKPLSKITAFDVERYKKNRLGQPVRSRKALKRGEQHPTVKPSTINRELATLSHFLNKAVEWGWIQHSPAKIRKLKEDTGRIVYLTAEQAEALLEAAKADQNRQIYPFILIGLRTAMRKSEILSIRREHIDLSARTIYVPDAKAGARTQPITPDLAEFLEGYTETLPKGAEWLFPSLGARSGHTVDVRKPFVRCVERSGLDPKQVVRHTLRHTAITHLVQAGVDLPTVKRISGHKTLAMVERYAHQSGAHIAEAMEKLDRRYSPKPQSA
ncbi:MAG: site-specific integrase, partial [Alphaproteobacteria bacterium]|nr:site-specific integrase [Alphaproteobacteria bacterium]